MTYKVIKIETFRKPNGQLYLRGLTMAGGELGNQVSTSLTTSRVLYMFKKLVMPLATTSPATESPGKIAANPWAFNKL